MIEQDFPTDDLVKLNEEQLDDVAGGALWFGEYAQDGHEIGCWWPWYKEVNPVLCPVAQSKKHSFIYKGKKQWQDGAVKTDGYSVTYYYSYEHCGTSAIYIS